jgi:hypothetical protein
MERSRIFLAKTLSVALHYIYSRPSVQAWVALDCFATGDFDYLAGYHACLGAGQE